MFGRSWVRFLSWTFFFVPCSCHVDQSTFHISLPSLKIRHLYSLITVSLVWCITYSIFLSCTALEVFKAGCPVPKCFVQTLISESVAKRAVQNLSVLFCEGWAAECDASCVPLDMVLASDDKNREELVRILLQHNANARGLKKSSKSPLSMCLEEDKLDLAVILLQHGADESDLVERGGESPFHASLRISLKKGEK